LQIAGSAAKVVAREPVRCPRQLVDREVAGAPELFQRRPERGRVGNGDSEQLRYSIGAERRRAVSGPSSEVMADDDGLVGAERVNQRKGVARQRFLVGIAIRDRGGVVPRA